MNKIYNIIVVFCAFLMNYSFGKHKLSPVEQVKKIYSQNLTVKEMIYQKLHHKHESIVKDIQKNTKISREYVQALYALKNDLIPMLDKVKKENKRVYKDNINYMVWTCNTSTWKLLLLPQNIKLNNIVIKPSITYINKEIQKPEYQHIHNGLLLRQDLHINNDHVIEQKLFMDLIVAHNHVSCDQAQHMIKPLEDFHEVVADAVAGVQNTKAALDVHEYLSSLGEEKRAKKVQKIYELLLAEHQYVYEKYSEPAYEKAFIRWAERYQGK